MKKSFSRIFVINISVIMVFIISMSNIGCIRTKPGFMLDDTPTLCYLPFEIKTDKREYDYGDEILVNIIFMVDFDERERDKGRDGCTYAVKIKESPYYEIVGNDEVFTTGYESDVPYIGSSYAHEYWYRADFKIKIAKESEGVKCLDVVIKCVEEDWSKASSYHYLSNDMEYPFAIKYFGFISDDKGITFAPIVTPITLGIDESVVRRFIR